MLDALIVTPGSSADLRGRDPRDTFGLPGKDEGKARLAALTDELSSFQARLYAEGKQSVLLVLQGLDASGKDGTIRHVFTGVNPQGCHVTSFKAPTPNRACPRLPLACARRVSAARHDRHLQPLALRGRRDGRRARARAAGGLAAAPRADRRVRAPVGGGRDDGPQVLPARLRRGAAKEARRAAVRSDEGWKYNPGDEETNRRYDEFTAAYDDAISATSTEHAPWYVIPADRNWLRNLAVATVLVEALRRLDPRFPEVPARDSPQSADL